MNLGRMWRLVIILAGTTFFVISAGCNNDGDEVHHLEPQEIADENGFIDHFHKNHKANLINICSSCHKVITRNKTIYKKTKTSEGIVLMAQ